MWMKNSEGCCCGNCVWAEQQGEEWVCNNEESEAFGLETLYDDYCDDYSNRYEDLERRKE